MTENAERERKLTNENYIHIGDWMLEYGLNERELTTFALVYGYVQGGKEYYASLGYLSEWLGLGDNNQNALRYYNSLINKGLLIKTSKGNGCIYKSTKNKGKVTDCKDFIDILPWMTSDVGLHLKGKDLILYALIYSYSREGSGNYCFYREDYFLKWLRIRRDHLDRQIDRLLGKGLIKKYKDGYKAVIPNCIDKWNCSQNESTTCKTENAQNIIIPQNENILPKTDNSQNESTPQSDSLDTQIEKNITQIESLELPKMRDNNSSFDNTRDNLFLYNNNEKDAVVDKKAFEDFYSIAIFTSELWKNQIVSDEEKSQNSVNRAYDLFKKIADSLNNNEKFLFMKLEEIDVVDLFEKAYTAVYDAFNSFNNPGGYLRKAINDRLNELEKGGI